MQEGSPEIGLALTGRMLDSAQTIRSVQQLAVDIGLPANLAEAGARKEDFRPLRRQCAEGPCSRGPIRAPRTPSRSSAFTCMPIIVPDASRRCHEPQAPARRHRCRYHHHPCDFLRPLEVINRAPVNQVPRYEFSRRDVIYQSPVIFTPLTGGRRSMSSRCSPSSTGTPPASIAVRSKA